MNLFSLSFPLNLQLMKLLFCLRQVSYTCLRLLLRTASLNKAGTLYLTNLRRLSSGLFSTHACSRPSKKMKPTFSEKREWSNLSMSLLASPFVNFGVRRLRLLLPNFPVLPQRQKQHSSLFFQRSFLSSQLNNLGSKTDQHACRCRRFPAMAQCNSLVFSSFHLGRIMQQYYLKLSGKIEYFFISR